MGKSSSDVSKNPEPVKVTVQRISSKPVAVMGACTGPVVIRPVMQLPIINEKVVPWSYSQVMVMHKGKEVVEEKLRKFKTDMSVKIKEEVTKQLQAKVIRVTRYPDWLANVVSVPKKDGKIRVSSCILAPSAYSTRSKGPPTPPPPRPTKNKNKGKMGDTSARNKIKETSQNASITKETATHLEQTLLRFREELEQVRNLPISDTPESDSKDSLIQNLAAELKRLTSRVQGVEDSKGVEGLNYEDLCVQLDVGLLEGYKPPKFEMFDGTGDPRVHLTMYCDKLVGGGRDEKIRMKLFMRSLKGDPLSWYISQDAKKWTSWVNMASDFMDRFRFNTENTPDVLYIQNLKKKPTETFREYATHWRTEATKVRPALEEEQMNRFFVRAQDPQYYERMMLIEGQKFSDIIKLGERIEEGIKNGMVTNLKALQATNKA
ncbi:uncharacterized protein [Nicotiana sylvestris]|uniref:uncharacterized protein n=1 Tax=Nicotiana sylvestris TaxID=4096 RepID=UPI00388CC072